MYRSTFPVETVNHSSSSPKFSLFVDANLNAMVLLNTGPTTPAPTGVHYNHDSAFGLSTITNTITRDRWYRTESD
eukprot:scaffold49195_cov43-Cyclotella_meneghiniana.AAC.1